MYASAYVWDNTSKFAYCTAYSYTPFGGACGFAIWDRGAKCTSLGIQNYQCSYGSGNVAAKGTLGPQIITANYAQCYPPGSAPNNYPGLVTLCILHTVPFNSTHQYFLNLTVGAIVSVESEGWPMATAQASVDLAGTYGSTLGLISVQ